MQSTLVGWRGLLAATVVGVAAALALAAVAPPAVAASKSEKKRIKVDVAGQQVFVDPETGRLIQPTREEARRLREALGVLVTQAPEEITVQQLADGTLMADMQDSAQEIAVATIGPNGEADVVCVHGADAAEAIVQQRTKVKAPAATEGAGKSKRGKETGKRGPAKAQEE